MEYIGLDKFCYDVEKLSGMDCMFRDMLQNFYYDATELIIQ